MSLSFDDSGAQELLDKLGAAANEAVRPAAQAAAEVMYREAKLRCPVSDGAHYFYGSNSKKSGVRYYFEAGNLRDSIYQVYSKDNSSNSRAQYHIAWNHQKAPYGFMVEFGTSRAAAHPFLRPAYEATSRLAAEVARDVYFNILESKVKQ